MEHADAHCQITCMKFDCEPTGNAFQCMCICVRAGLQDRQRMAAAFADLPVRVWWRLAQSQVPDQAAVDQLGLGDNTKVAPCLQ